VFALLLVFCYCGVVGCGDGVGVVVVYAGVDGVIVGVVMFGVAGVRVRVVVTFAVVAVVYVIIIVVHILGC